MRTNKMLYDKEDMVQHSKKIRVVAYICAVILMPLYIGGPLSMIYLSAKRIPEADISTSMFLIAICGILTFVFGKFAYLMFRFLKTLKVSFTFDENGISLTNNGKTEVYSWSELEKSKEYTSCQIFCLIDSKGQHLFSVWEYADNYAEFRQMTAEKIGI